MSFRFLFFLYMSQKNCSYSSYKPSFPFFGGLVSLKHPSFFLSSSPSPSPRCCCRCDGLPKRKLRLRPHLQASPKPEVVSITYEEIGLFPRSFSRVLDRFLKQVFSDVDTLVIQEYRFYRYLFLTTLKCLFIFFFVPFFVNFGAKNYVIRPLTEYYWNTKQTELFLNSSQQKHAFSELKDYEEKFYFESLIYPKSLTKPIFKDRTTPPLMPMDSLSSLSRGLPKSITISPFFQKEDNDGMRFGKKKHIIFLKPFLFRKESDFSFFAKDFPELEPEYNSTVFLRLSDVKKQKAKRWRLADAKWSPKSWKTVFRNPQTASHDRPISPLQSSLEKQNVDSVVAFGVGETSTSSTVDLSHKSVFVFQTLESEKKRQYQYQEKTKELAQRYNDQSIEAITNGLGDIVSLVTLFYLLYVLEIQVNITQSFLVEVFFGLDDSQKSLLILLVTDLLVGYHSSNLWEFFFEFFFNHYGLPESQTGIFLLVATLPVLLDVLFKYFIFRHLNRSSPATVATYHAIIE